MIMSNLFMVFTPFQSFIAQEVIKQEKLENNILLKGYVNNSPQSLEIYSFLKEDSLWQKEYLMPNVSRWAEVDVYHPFKEIVRTRKDFCKLNRIVKGEHVGAIYMGEQNNYSYRLCSDYYSSKGIKIVFFEEGAAHYAEREAGGFLRHRPLMAKVYKNLFDYLLYLPLLGRKYGDWKFVKAQPIESVHIDERYSILPQYTKPFDKRLKCSMHLPARIQDMINKECEALDVSNSILFLDQPIYELVHDSMPVYFKTLGDYIDTLPKDMSIIIKYHPRETDEVKHMTEQLMEKKGRKYVVISKKINLPVEFYMQHIHFRKVVNFFTSSAFYNGYLFDKVEYVYLIEEFYKSCIDANLKFAHALDGLVGEYKKMKENQ